MTIEGGIRAYARQMVCQQFPPGMGGRRRGENVGEIHHPGDISYQATSHLSSSPIRTHATYCIL